jgi:hypothetical protein
MFQLGSEVFGENVVVDLPGAHGSWSRSSAARPRRPRALSIAAVLMMVVTMCLAACGGSPGSGHKAKAGGQLVWAVGRGDRTGPDHSVYPGPWVRTCALTSISDG